MKNRKRTFSSVYWQYVCSFTIVAMLVFAAMGVYLYRYYYNAMETEFQTAGKNDLNIIATRMGTDMQLLSNTAIQFGLSESITPFKLKEQANRSLSLKKQIKSHQMISQFYDRLYLVFGIDDYLYSSSTSIEMERFLNTFFVLDNTTAAQLYQLLRYPGMLSVLPEQLLQGKLNQQERVVLYLMPIQPGNTGTLLFVVDSAYYDRLLGSRPEDLRNAYIIYEDSIIVKRGSLPIDDKAVMDMAAGYKEATITKISYEGKDYLYAVQNEPSGFCCVTIQDMSVCTDKISSGQWRILLFFVLLLIPTAILVGVLSERLHKPVRAIRGSFEAAEGKNDFEAIRSGIVELSAIVDQSISARRAAVIRHFVRGQYATKAEMVEKCREVGLDVDKKAYLVVLTGSSHSMDDKPALEVLLKTLSAYESVTGYGTDLISQNQSLLALFSDDEQQLWEHVRRIHTTGKNHCESFVMAVSDIHNEFHDITRAYLEANTAYDNRFIMGDNEPLYFNDVTGVNAFERCPATYLDSLKNALRSGNEFGVENAIGDIFRYLRSKQHSLYTFRVLYNDIIQVLLQEWNAGDMKQSYDIFTLSRCLSIHDLDSMLRSFCAYLMSNRQQADGNAEPDGNDRMREAVAYMSESYNDSELNMNALANRLGISAAELSVKFKETMDISPSDYLTLLRINRAKELLLTTRLSVKEVCAAVGYTDVPGFTRRFKKYTGLTPAQYRQYQHQNDEKGNE